MKVAGRIVVLLFLCSIIFDFWGKEQKKKEDVIPPVISSDRDELRVDIRNGAFELREGLQAIDNVDGDITSEIIVGTISPFKEKGVCDVEYIVFDSNNNVGRYERTVYFEHYEAPKLKLLKPLAYEANGRVVISDRLVAEDMLEGDISGKMRFSSSNLSAYEVGTYELNVEVKNSYGDIVKYQLPINIVPFKYNKEYIQLEDYLVYTKVGENLKPKDYIKSVVGRNDEKVSLEQIDITVDVDFSIPGVGQICYELYEGRDVIYATYLIVIVEE